MQAAAPGTGLKKPGSHRTQADASATAENEPGGQSLHAVVPDVERTRNCPGEQLVLLTAVQLAAPARLVVPVGQS